MNFINKIEFSSNIWGCVDGVNMLALAALARDGKSFVYVARDDVRMATMRDAVARLAPNVSLAVLPAWDCLPFDRLSPQGGLVGQRIDALSALAAGECQIVLTTIKRKLIINNVLVLEIDEKGILAKKDFYDINDMNDLEFDKKRSESLQKRNFIYNFLSSMRQRINDPLGVRKKRREEGVN